MMNIDIARENLLKQERLRPAPGQFSALWEGGESWRQAFNELVAVERSDDAQFEQLLDAATRLEARRERLQQWSSSLHERQAWHDQLASVLGKHQRLWNVDEHGQSLAPNELFTHQALLELHTIACASRRTFVELEYLEYRRRGFGQIDEQQWQAAWADLLQAFRQQVSRYRHWFNADLSEDRYAERLGWCLRLQRLQMATQRLWGDRHDVDWSGLSADAATVDRVVDSLRPGHISNTNPVGAIVGIIIVLLILGFLFGGGSGDGQPPTTTPTTTALAADAPLVQAPATLAGDLGTLNEEGKELLKQGRCEEAIQRFQAAFDANPGANQAYEPLNNMAFCLYELGRNEQAITTWQQALSIEPNSPDANAGMGMVLYEAGRQDEGIAYYRNALHIKAEYADENWLRTVALWSEHAIAASRELRGASRS